MLCKNSRCRATLTSYQWGDGFCSKRCMSDALPRGQRLAECLHDPTDPTGRRHITRNADEFDAFIEALEIDRRLPRIIYLRRMGHSRRFIARDMRCDEKLVRTILQKSAPNVLRRCGLSRP